MDLDAKPFLATNMSAIRDRLRSAGTDQLVQFQKLYKKDEWLDKPGAEALSEFYLAAAIKEAGGGPLSLEDYLNIARRAQSNGFISKTIPGVKIIFVQVTSRTLLREGQIDFPAEIVVDMPFEAAQSDLNSVFASAQAEGADYVAALAVALAKTSRRVKKIEKIDSKYLSGYRTEPNPAYNIAQQELNMSQFALQSASMRTATTNAQFCNGIGCLGKIISQIAVAAAEGEAKTKLEKAMEKLRNTPMTIQVPIYKDYRVDKALITATKLMTANYYVIDRRRKSYFKSTFDISEQREFAVIYKLHNKDTDKEAILAQGHTEKQVDVWEQEAVDIKLSRIVDHYLKNKGDSKQLVSEEALRIDMVRDRNLALNTYKANIFEGSTEKDPRFDSVVMVHNPQGSMGSGFYVKPDLVLTNYHVVGETKFVEMTLYDKRETFGKVIARDARLDLALIKVQTRGKPVRFYTRNQINLGSTIEVIGHPQGLEFTISRGVVSAVRRLKGVVIEGGKKVLWVQSDAAISPGNSGGPWFVGDRVVAVTSFSNVKSGSENLNLGVHYSEVLRFMKEVLGPGS